MLARTGRFKGSREGEVLVKMAVAGVCHSDDHYATGDAIMSPDLVVMVEAGRGLSRAAVVGDVRREEDVQRAVETAVDRFGGIDICLNNASTVLQSW